MKTKHGNRRMGNKGRPNSAKNNMKGEVGNNNNGVMNRGVCVLVC